MQQLCWLLARAMAEHDGVHWHLLWAPEQHTYLQDAERTLQDLQQLVPRLRAADRAEVREQLGLS